MIMYKNFHGLIDSKNIGKVLRDIAKLEKNNFKILTGYGSQCGICISKQVAIKSLLKMKREGIIKGFLPGEIKYQLLKPSSLYFIDKLKYFNVIKNDKDFGNEGIIFVFLE